MSGRTGMAGRPGGHTHLGVESHDLLVARPGVAGRRGQVEERAQAGAHEQIAVLLLLFLLLRVLLCRSRRISSGIRSGGGRWGRGEMGGRGGEPLSGTVGRWRGGGGWGRG